jgi:LL-diaminopimelate aminotransferase
MRLARRIQELPPYLFAGIDRKKKEAASRGIDVVDFGVGDPDRPTPDHIVEAAAKALRDPVNHRYPSYYGLPEFRTAVAEYYQRRFGVTLDPDTQVLPLIGSKEGLAHLSTAFIDPGDSALIPDPAYPVYETSTLLSGGDVVRFPMPVGNELRELEGIPPSDIQRAKVLWLCYPNNPTAVVCDVDLFNTAVGFARDHDLLVAHDAAYIEITFDGYTAPSLLEAPGALDVGVEFGSLSKTFNMTGWRVGWVAGAAEAIEALGRVKTNVDSGVFNALQIAGITALEGPTDLLLETVEVYRNRRDKVVNAFNSVGWDLEAPKGSCYLWVATPNGESSVEFTEFLLEKAGVIVAPGSGYGANGEGYIRISLTVDDERLDIGLDRIVEALGKR